MTKSEKEPWNHGLRMLCGEGVARALLELSPAKDKATTTALRGEISIYVRPWVPTDCWVVMNGDNIVTAGRLSCAAVKECSDDE